MLPRRQLVHLEEKCLDGDAHLGLADALDPFVNSLISPSTRLVGAAVCFPGRTVGLAAGLMLYPCPALVFHYWRVLKDPFPGLITPPLSNAIRKIRIHMPCGKRKWHGDVQISKACSAGLYVLLRALITIWPNFGPK